MRISAWSSDWCSSDLYRAHYQLQSAPPCGWGFFRNDLFLAHCASVPVFQSISGEQPALLVMSRASTAQFTPVRRSCIGMGRNLRSRRFRLALSRVPVAPGMLLELPLRRPLTQRGLCARREFRVAAEIGRAHV